MTSDLLQALRENSAAEVSPLMVHAHPDDETLQTGGLLAWCSAREISVDVCTCTRGEQGQIVQDSIVSTITRDDLARVRAHEKQRAMDILGVMGRYWLGTPPARTRVLPPRTYTDSGMEWLREGLAGPADVDDPLTFTKASIDEAVDDLTALVTKLEPTLLISYDRAGSYGHPDHIRAHEITWRTARATGTPMLEVASTPDDPAFEWFDFSEFTDTIIAALEAYATQLTVRDGHIVHVGGQIQQLPTRIGLRYADLEGRG